MKTLKQLKVLLLIIVSLFALGCNNNTETSSTKIASCKDSATSCSIQPQYISNSNYTNQPTPILKNQLKKAHLALK